MVRIPETTPLPTSLSRTLGPSELLPVGRVLDAVVVHKRGEMLYELAAGRLKLLAESQQSLRAGDHLRLRVTGRDAQQRPTLQLETSAARQASTYLKAALPKQQEPTRLLASLWQLNQRNPGHPVLQKAVQVLQQLPNRNQLTDAAGLQRTISQSGLFLEHHLRAGSPAPENDLKSLLLRLLRTLGGEPGRPAAPARTAEPTTRPMADTYQPAPAARPTPTPSPQPPPAGAQAPRPAALPGTAAPPVGGETAPAGRTGAVAGEGVTRAPPPVTVSPAPTAGSAPSSPAETPDSGTTEPPSPRTPQPSKDTPAFDNRTVSTAREALPGQIRTLPRVPAGLDTGAVERLVSQLARETESTLSRLESHQLLHVQSRESQQPQWLLELPVRDRDGIDVWQLHIAREAKQDGRGAPEEHDRAWHITLSFDFPGTGPVMARLEQTAAALRIAFYAESADTDRLIGDHVNALESALTEKGVGNVKISHRQGLPHPDTLPHALRSVIEEQA